MIAIIGAGPIGIACAIELKKQGLESVIIDKGCLVNSIFLYPTNMTFFSTSERLELGDVPFISHQVKPTRKEALEYYRRVVSHYKLNTRLYEKVLSIKSSENGFLVHTQKERLSFEKVIIATGFYSQPQLMNVPGEDLPKVKHYYDEPHPYSGQKVAIIGAGNSAVDAALESYRAGAQVTMLIRGNEIKPSVKYWVKPDIENRIKENAIRGLFNTRILQIKEKSIVIETEGNTEEIDNDFVLAMTGYRPDYNLLTSIGIDIQNDESETPFYNEETHETNINGLFLAGVICGGKNTSKWFIENARVHAEIIAKYIADEK